MNNCQRYLEMMQEELDGHLSELEAKMLEKHVHQCPSCREEYAAFQSLGSLLNGFEMEEVPIDLKDLIMAEVMQIQNRQTVADVKVAREVDLREEVSKKPKFFVSLLVALASLNLVFFYYWLEPMIGVRVNTHGFVVFYRLVSSTFSKFAMVGRHTGDALQTIARAIAGVIPWEWVFIYTILTGISVVGMLSMFRKRGGNVT